jgi:membrane associated rhomboid family serine protease
MFPLRDNNPTSRIPVITYAIIATNAVVWGFLQGFGTSPALFYSICQYGLIPGELLDTAPAGTVIQLSESMICTIDHTTNWSSVFSSMFMHGSWFHIISNMWFMFVFGDNVEDRLGRIQFVGFYLVCGLNQPTRDSYTRHPEYAETGACALMPLKCLALECLKGANLVWTR